MLSVWYMITLPSAASVALSASNFNLRISTANWQISRWCNSGVRKSMLSRFLDFACACARISIFERAAIDSQRDWRISCANMDLNNKTATISRSGGRDVPTLMFSCVCAYVCVSGLGTAALMWVGFFFAREMPTAAARSCGEISIDKKSCLTCSTEIDFWFSIESGSAILWGKPRRVYHLQESSWLMLSLRQMNVLHNRVHEFTPDVNLSYLAGRMRATEAR